MSNVISQRVNEYAHFRIAGKEITIPYVIAEEAITKHHITTHTYTTKRFENYGAKGTPTQIRKVLLATAKKYHFDLGKADPKEITRFMEEKGIGIDCSGFVYYVLDGYLQKEKKLQLKNILLRYPGILGKIERFLLQYNRVRRISVATFTNELNSVKIEKAKDIQVGDMLRLTPMGSSGKHIAIVIATSPKEITYAMSSDETTIQGAHIAKIQITNPEKGLEYQKWLEITVDNQNYGKQVFDPKRGDAVRRLTYLVISG